MTLIQTQQETISYFLAALSLSDTERPSTSNVHNFANVWLGQLGEQDSATTYFCEVLIRRLQRCRHCIQMLEYKSQFVLDWLIPSVFFLFFFKS